MATAAPHSRPSLSHAEGERIESSIVEWKRSARALLALSFSELWVPFDLEHGYDSSGRLVAERSAIEPGRLLLVDYRPSGAAVFVKRFDSCVACAELTPHSGWFRPSAIWLSVHDDVPKTLHYVDDEFGLERIDTLESNGIRTEYRYERHPNGALARVLQVSPDGTRVLWPVPGRAAVAGALAEVASLASPISAAVQRLAGEEKSGLCVLSFSAEDSYVPPILSWLAVSEVAALRSAGMEREDLWMTAEWPQTDLPYMDQAEMVRWLTLNDAVCQKPRAAEKAVKGLARLVEAELRAKGVTCVVAALPLEVEDKHERLVKKQVSSSEWELLRTWGLVR